MILFFSSTRKATGDFSLMILFFIARPSRQKLYVGNLSFYTTEETLSEVFSEFGEVFDCYIPEDPDRGSSRGFGFITMDAGAGTEAIEALDGCELDGRIIAVNEAQAKRKTRVDYDKENDDEA
jgi:RNA recognition motif-containing protein